MFKKENINKLEKWCELVSTQYRKIYVDINDKYITLKSVNYKNDIIQKFYNDESIEIFLKDC